MSTQPTTPAESGPVAATPQMRRAIPRWLLIPWLVLVPFGLPFTLRIGWERIVWTRTRGPQAIGFSLFHLHPGFAILGALSSSLIVLSILPICSYMIRRRQVISRTDIAILLLTTLISAILLLPDSVLGHAVPTNTRGASVFERETGGHV